MSEQQLQEAVASVRKHFIGRTVNENTVLAAYMRAAGKRPAGAEWIRAKQAFKDGASFEDAAGVAGTQAPAPGSSRVERMDTNTNVHISGQLGAPEAAARVSKLDDPIESLRSPLDRHTPVPERLAAWEQDLDSVDAGSLEWFPKVFGPGDIDGEGAKKLLGTPNIPTVSVLVRETAQNSWDARIGHLPVDFRIHLRRASQAERRLLREHVFTGRALGLDLVDSLDKPDLWLLEVSDRGTRGLGGPTRNDLEPPPGATTDFIDLIFNVGAPRDVHLGGGTYGFGKTIAYRVSRPGTVLFWSRSRESDGLEDRLIGSAIGSSFADAGVKYTGRHWWGEMNDGHIGPLTGQPASALATSLFFTQFHKDQSGTSLLIVDPDLGGDSPQEDAERLARACLWHLWPKIVRGQGIRTPMNIEVMFEGQPVTIPDPGQHPLLAGAVDALSAVRAAQQAGSHTPEFSTQVKEVWCLRPKTLLGHLALTRFPQLPVEAGIDDEVDAVGSPTCHVSLMRHDAELVVKYAEFARLDHPSFQWFGVFKPVATVDDHFAASEPPAHDDWIPASMANRQNKRLVNVALKRIRELVAEFLQPLPTNDESDSSGPSTAALADALSGLVGALHGSAPGLTKSRSSGRKASKKPKVEVKTTLLGGMVGGRRQGYALIEASTPSGSSLVVTATADVGVEGGSDHDADLAAIIGWTDDPASGVMRSGGNDLILADGESSWVLFEFDPGVAVDLNARPKRADA